MARQNNRVAYFFLTVLIALIALVLWLVFVTPAPEVKTVENEVSYQELTSENE